MSDLEKQDCREELCYALRQVTVDRAFASSRGIRLRVGPAPFRKGKRQEWKLRAPEAEASARAATRAGRRVHPHERRLPFGRTMNRPGRCRLPMRDCPPRSLS